LKLSILFTAVALFTSHQALAQCNTVMGGCTTEQTVNVAPHMRDSAKHESNTKATSASTATNKNINNANVKNANASNSPASKTTTKKM
jgi:hypothetical protein